MEFEYIVAHKFGDYKVGDILADAAPELVSSNFVLRRIKQAIKPAPPNGNDEKAVDKKV